LIQQTAGRVRAGRPIVICSAQHRFHVQRQMREAGLATDGIVLEPAGRNTAPAAAIAALLAARSDPQAIVALLPSDHVIRDAEAFGTALDKAVAGAGLGFIVTFGIRPAAPETGYGYIEQGEPIGQAAGLYRVARFVEKPNRETAQSYLAEGGYSWNSGMFVFRADVMLSELEKQCPDVLAGARKALDRARVEENAVHLDEDAFKALPNISVDYAVMEKTGRAAVVPCDIGWSDIGSWSALWDIERKDGDNNAFEGDVISHGASGSYVHSPKILTALVGVKDVVVVATEDAVLVADKNRAQEIKHVVDALKAAGRPEAVEQKIVHRPWGTYQTIDSGPGYQVKQIVVYPGGRLSLQMHHKRAEHWTVVEGEGQVTCDDKVFALRTNESTFIPLGARHRLENFSDKPLTLIEVQCGSYLGEDDIVRFDDIYGRAPAKS
ncbi:MAG: mannose-1-phosphate guanylyltransferase/mannose-6-phosphate isomerase, partial [Rhizomicrobium sp.]